MSTAVAQPTPDGAGAVTPRSFPTPPIGRLVLVELRKMIDTRSGRWLLIVAVLIALVIAVVRGLTGSEADRTLEGAFELTLFPFGVLLPVIGILTATSEWSQRTALTTYALVPRRMRIGVAKLLAAMLLALVALVVCLLMGAVGNVVAMTAGGAEGSWSISASELLQALVANELNLLMGVGFGLLLMSPALAIVAFFALPTVFSIVGELVSGFDKVWAWIDTSVTFAPLMEGEATGNDWAKLMVSALIWIAIPIALGLIRTNRREAK
ncbi:MAG: ABC transporter permease [Patulibacter sp.]|nr:ABC transporter permease [Patulibacter sp.]